MAERLKRAAAWLGLVTDDRYSDDDEADDDQEPTEGISREELLGAARAVRQRDAAGDQAEQREPLPPFLPLPYRPPSRPRTADMSRIITVHPRTYNEARASASTSGTASR